MKKLLIAVSLITAHALIGKGVVTGKFEFFSVERDPMIYWIDVIISGLCLLVVDFVIVRHLLSAKREKPGQPPEPTRAFGPSGSS